MSQEIINIGAAANDGTGDPLRTAFDKVNNNFTQLYTTLSASGPDGSIQFKNTNTLYSTLYVDGTYLVAGAPGRIYYSTDNSVWFPATSGTEEAIYSLAYDGIDTIIAVGANGTILRSNDGGVTWTSSTSGVTENLYGAVGYNGSLAVVGANGTILTSHVGGEGYTAVPTVTIAAPANAGGITATATATLANGRVSGFTITQPGLGYTTAPTVTISSPTSGLTATADAIVSGGIVSAIDLTSGVNWYQPVTGVTNTLTGITHGNLNISTTATPIYVATGVTGTIVTSTNLVTWSSVTTGSAQDLYSATIDPLISKLIVVGANGTVLTTFDTSIWTTEISNVSTTLTSVAFGVVDTITDLIAVSNVGTAIRSNNGGVNWYTAAANTTTNPLLGVTFVPNTSNVTSSLFLAVGSNATVINTDVLSLANAWSLQSVGSALQGDGNLVYFPETQTLSANANIVPGTDSVFSLGSPNLKFNDLYLAGNSIYLGTAIITSNANNSVTFTQSSNNANLSDLISNSIITENAVVYGNINAGEYMLANNVTTYNLSAANANIPNLISNVANANIINANRANIANLTSANANITSLIGGNANLSGNITANYFFGNGAFLTGISGSNADTGNVTFDNITVQGVNGLNLSAGADFTANSAYLQVRAGDVATHIHLDTGNNAFYDQYIGDDNKYVKLEAGDAGNIIIGTNDGNASAWTFGSDGNLNLPTNGDLNFDGGSIAQTLNEDIYIRASDDESDGWSVYTVVDDGAGNTLSHTRLEFDQYTIRTDAQGAAYTWAFRDTGVLELPGDIAGNAGSNLTVRIGDQAGSNTFIDLQTRSYVGDALISNIRVAPNVTISTSNAAHTWTFDDAGNLTLPANTFAVNYANGVQVPISGGGGSELVNGDNSFVLNSDGDVTFEGNVAGQGINRGLIWDYGANANGVDSTVVQNNDGITVRAWTENGGGANGYSAPVNIVTNQNANTNTWVFDGSGNLTLAGNIQSVNTGFAFSGTITSIQSFAYPTPPVITIAEELFEGPATGQVTISNLSPSTGALQANGTWYYEATEINQFTLYADAALTEPVDTSTWTAYEGPGGNAVSVGEYTDFTIQGGNVAIGSNDNTWTFDTTGDINIPTNAASFSKGRIQSANGYPTLLAYGTGEHGGPELDWANTNNVNDLSNANVLRNTLYINDGGFYVGMNENNVANTFTGSWRFTPIGTTIFPTLEVDLHNGGVQEGQVLQFGNSSQQAIITGPTPAANVNAQRLIIQGQRGNSTNSEGGDVYVWAGDAELYGGDIKIYAGDADDTADGYGGYVNIDGGQGFTEGGHVAINGGQSTNGPGGYVEIYAGQGNSHGGNLTLGAGYGLAGPGGAVTIQGGGSGNGLSAYGNVGISAGASSWTFDNAGNLTLPANTFAVNYANGEQVPLGGGSTGNVTFSNVTVQGVNGLNLSAGADFTANSAYLQIRAGDFPSHIHFDTGNNQAYDLIVGNDNKFVQVSSTGNILMSSYDGSNSYLINLDTSGNLTIPGVIATRSTPQVGSALLIATNDQGGNGGWGATALAVAWTAEIINTYPVGSTITFSNGDVRTITQVDDYGPTYIDIFFNSSTTSNPFFPITLKTDNYVSASTDNLVIKVPNGPGVPSSVIEITYSSGSWESNPVTNLVTTGGTGTGLTVNVTENGGYADTIAIATAGSGYTNGDTITVTSGSSNATFTISVAVNEWAFGNTSILTLPGEGIIQSINDTIILQSVDANSNIYSARLGTNGGLYFATTQYSQGWLSLENNSGNANITAASGTAGAAGKNMYITAGAADQSDYYTTAGGSVNLIGGLGASNDGGGGGPGGNVNLIAGNSADSAGHAGNINITAGSNDWVFDYTGNLTIPNVSGGFIKTESNASIAIAAMDNGTNNPAQLLSMNVGNGNVTSIVSAYSTNVAIQTNASGLINTWTFDNAGNLTLPGSLIATSASPSPIINGFSITNSFGVTSSGKIGYTAGGAVTQTGTGQGVTLNQLTGKITLAKSSWAAGDLEAFNLSCNKIADGDMVLVQMVDSIDAPLYNAVAYKYTPLANSIQVLVKCLESVTSTPVVQFMIVKAPVS